MTGEQRNVAPRLSIGLPVYNGESYLPQALDSLLAQTFRDFEIVICDNGSTDRTEAICTEYGKRNNQIRYFREPTNRGACWNFNRVYELSRGEYFKWAACDDICAPTFLERCINVLDNDQTVVCCHSRTAKINQSGQRLPNLPDPTDGGVENGKRRPDASSRSVHRRFRDVLLSIGWSARSFGVIRSASLQRTRLIEPHYGWEKVLMAELSLMGRFFDVPEVLFFQRIHDEASSNLTTAAKQQEFIDPTRKDQHTSPRLRLLQGHLAALWRHPLTPNERLLCLAGIGRYVFQVRKWRSCVSDYYYGTGIGGGMRKDLRAPGRVGNHE